MYILITLDLIHVINQHQVLQLITVVWSWKLDKKLLTFHQTSHEWTADIHSTPGKKKRIPGWKVSHWFPSFLRVYARLFPSRLIIKTVSMSTQERRALIKDPITLNWEQWKYSINDGVCVCVKLEEAEAEALRWFLWCHKQIFVLWSPQAEREMTVVKVSDQFPSPFTSSWPCHFGSDREQTGAEWQALQVNMNLFQSRLFHPLTR